MISANCAACASLPGKKSLAVSWMAVVAADCNARSCSSPSRKVTNRPRATSASCSNSHVANAPETKSIAESLLLSQRLAAMGTEYASHPGRPRSELPLSLTDRGILSVNNMHREAPHSIRSAPRHGRPQDWRHRAMRKGFVSEGDLNPYACDLGICALVRVWKRISAVQKHGSSVRGRL